MTHIALVDDETSILTSVKMALQTEGFTVDTYLNGEDALAGLEIKKYDLGLFDIKISPIKDPVNLSDRGIDRVFISNVELTKLVHERCIHAGFIIS